MSSAMNSRVIKGLGAKGIGQGTFVVVRMAEIPLFLHFWGAELYGEWLILAALPIFFSVSDFGFSGAAAREITMLAGNHRRQEALAVFQTIFTFIIGLFSLILVFLLSVIAALPVEQLIGLEHIDDNTFLLSAGLLGLSTTLLILMRLLMGPYNSEGRFSTGYLLITFTLAGQFVLSAVALAIGAGPLIVAVVMLAAQITGLVLMRSLLYQIAPWVRIGLSHFDWNKVISLVSPSFAGMALPIGQAISSSGIRIVIAVVLGPAAVVTFVAHRQLARLITVVGTFAQPFEVELSKMFGSGDIKSFNILSTKSIQILFWSILAAILILWNLAPSFFLFWVGAQISFDVSLFAILLCSSALEAYWIIALTPSMSINQHVKPATLYVVFALALLPLAYLACRWLGLYALAVILAITEAAMLVVVVRQVLSISGRHFSEWLAAVTSFPWFVLTFVKRVVRRSS